MKTVICTSTYSYVEVNLRIELVRDLRSAWSFGKASKLYRGSWFKTKLGLHPFEKKSKINLFNLSKHLSEIHLLNSFLTCRQQEMFKKPHALYTSRCNTTCTWPQIKCNRSPGHTLIDFCEKVLDKMRGSCNYNLRAFWVAYAY